MAMRTGISWCDSTANLWIGCTKVSGACDHCYAEDMMGTEGSRYKRVQWGPRGPRLFCKAGWADLRTWQRRAARNGGVDPELGRRRIVFINSLSDFFDNHRSVIWRPTAWELFRECTHLIIILVTKRPQLIKRELPPFWDEIAHRIVILTTVEDQANANWRLTELFEPFRRGVTEPLVLGVSIEPQLGPINLKNIHSPRSRVAPDVHGWSAIWRNNGLGRPWLRWVICGGESGKLARPSHPDWFRALRDDCAAYGIDFHLKQWGEWAPHTPVAGGDLGGDVRRGHVTIVHPSGSSDVEVYEATGGRNTEPGSRYMARVGKAKAGRMLDGRVHDDIPELMLRAA